MKERGREPNLEFGRELLNKLAVFDPADIDNATFWVYGMLGRNSTEKGTDYDPMYYAGEMRGNAAGLAARGLRLVFEDWQTVETTKSGKTKVTYLTQEEAEERLWEWLDQASAAEEVFGRGLIIFAAARDAIQHVVPKSDRTQGVRITANKQSREALEACLEDVGLPTEALAKLARSIKAFKPYEKAKKVMATEKKEHAQEKAEAAKAAKAEAKPKATAAAKAEASAGKGRRKATTPKPKAAAKPRRRGAASMPAKGSGTRAVEALSFVQGHPGITIPELAAKMGVKQNYLYRVLPALETEGKVEKKDRGWYPAK